MESDPARRSGREHAVDDHAVEVQVEIERGTETVGEGHRAEARRASSAWTVRAQALLHHAQEQAQGSTQEVGVAFQEVTQALRHRQYP